MVKLKALPSAGTILISRDDSDATTQNLILTNAELYLVAFAALDLLGMVRAAGPNNSAIITLTVPTPSKDEEISLMDPTHEVVPSLQSVLAHLNRPH